MKRLGLLLTIPLLFLISCSPSHVQLMEPPNLTFQKTPSYSVQEQLNAIPKPEPITRIYAIQTSPGTFKAVENPKDATYIILAPAEYAKVGAIIKLAGTYKELTIEQENLINIYISEINALKELVLLEQKKAQAYQEMWVNSENNYRDEREEHKKDTLINKIVYGATIAGIIIIAIAL